MLVALAASALAAAPALATSLHVDSKDNIFGAGHATLPPASNGAGTKPPSSSVAGHSGDAVTFSNVTGQISCINGPTNGPDGSTTCAGGNTNINSLAGISGIVNAQRTMFLTGVFIGAKEPADPAPDRLDFSASALGIDFASFTPKLDQTFYIGDGHNAIGAQQQFVVPSGARRLYLGFADAFGFRGNPGAYDDNIGSVRATFSVGPFTPPPVAGKSVVADVVSGTVLIRVPSGKRIRRGKGSAVAAATRFKRFRGRANIPVGSILDTRKGRLAITSAADLKGATQSGEFYDGVFQIKQARASHPITDAELITSRAKCGKGSAHASASKRLGRLWATGKGKFRTKGRYSAASVRGTTWLTEDRCDGTFTKVSRGRVSVRDNVKHKTVILTAGQSYLARAQRASSNG
jgi:hypothetical protein